MNDGYKLKTRRKEINKTMLQIAQQVGVSEATISRWESGDIANMRRDRIVLLADALQVTPDWIMNIDEKTTNQNNTLSREEQRLIENFRSLSEQGKDYILQTMNMAINTYKKSDYSELQQEAQ